MFTKQMLDNYYQTFENFDQVNQEFANAIRLYYQNYYSVNSLRDVIGMYRFNHREFGFIYELPKKNKKKQVFERNLTFDTPSDLVLHLQLKAPIHSYVGGVFKNKLGRGKSITTSDFCFREICFDIDIKDFDAIRSKICKCQGKNICNKCLELPKEAVIFAIDTLRADLGFTDFKVVFSGGGGFHIWVKDDLAKYIASVAYDLWDERESRTIEKNLRLSIVNYLMPFEVSKRGTIVVHDETIRPYSLYLRIINQIVTNFFLKSPNELIVKLGLPISEVIKLKAELSKGPMDFNQYKRLMSRVGDRNSQRRFEEFILRYRFPRYDKAPTQDIVRVLRVPDSIHGVTGNICSLVKDISSFSTSDIDSIFNYIREQEQSETLF